MIDPADIVTLRVNGTDYAGWTGIPTIQLGIERGAGAFKIELSERWPGGRHRPIGKEDSCALSIGAEVVITGQVDEVERQLGKDSHTISVSGRDATGELIDCAATNKPGEWRDRTLEQIAGEICAPFGIKVRVIASTGAAFSTFTLQKGETAFAAIKRLCQARGVLPYSDGLGALVIGPGSPARIRTALVEGINVKAGATGKDSRLERWRDYTVLSQSGMWDDAKANAGTVGTAHDPGIRRYRPTAKLADDLADGVTATHQALWEAHVAKAKAETASIPVQGWCHAGGVWRPNTLVQVHCPAIGIEGWRLIAAVEMKIGKEGTETSLSLVGEGAFDTLAAKAKEALQW